MTENKNTIKRGIYCISTDDRILKIVRKKYLEEEVNALGYYGKIKTMPLKDAVDTSRPFIEQIQRLFNKMKRPYEVYEWGDQVCIEIEWGDHRHDHGDADYIMKTAFGFDLVEENVTEENGDDCYSSVHVYKKA